MKRKETTIDDDEPDYEKEDEYGRTRLHAWIFVQKLDRSVNEEFFIEPTTGRKYNIEDSPYFSIQAAFNHQNFWINLDPSRDIRSMNMNFEEDPDSNWEFVMIQTKKKNGGDDDNGDGSDQDDDN